MRIREQARKVAQLAGAMRDSREAAARERWPREQLRAYQQERLEAIVRHAAATSPLYRERLAGVLRSGPVELERLPVLEKTEMMERFDELVTDRSLQRDELLAWLEGADATEPYRGRYRVMATSGSSGRKGLFVYDRPGWRSILVQFLRYNAMIGVRPRLPRRLRIAGMTGASGAHMSRQAADSISVGLHRVMALDVTTPIPELVETLNGFEPDLIFAYPSLAVRLAEEQEAGRLRIAPGIVSTGSELRTAEMTARIARAFGIEPFDLYATTEGLWGSECERHEGIHLFEDTTLVENVDAEGRSVPEGERGASLLVTNLNNRVQPIIRLAVADAVTIDPDPCPCGRTLIRMASVDGRSDDVLELPAGRGRTIPVFPIEFAPITRDREVREFQVIREPGALRVLIVAANGAGPDLERRVADLVGMRLAKLGAEQIEVSVERREALSRSAGGKLQLVVDRTPLTTDSHGGASS